MARVYRTMQGREIDMDKLIAKNELMPAIGNARVNARGDEIGNGGQIVKKREDVMNEYYENIPKRKQEPAVIDNIPTGKEIRGTNESKRKN